MQEIVQGVPLQHYIWLSSILFSIGVMGVLYRRNAIIIFMCVELMLNAVNLMLVAFSRYHSGTTGSSAQVFVFFIMAVAAAEVAVGLDTDDGVSQYKVHRYRFFESFKILKM